MNLCQFGPDYGYHPEPSKTVLIVNTKDELAAKELFGELGLKIVNEYHFLGGFIEEQDAVNDFVQEK